MSGIVLHIGAAIALASLVVSVQGAEIASANRHPDRSIESSHLDLAGTSRPAVSNIDTFAAAGLQKELSGDSAMDDLSTTRILKGRYEFRDRLQLNTHIGLDLGKGELGETPPGYTLRYWGPGPYRGSDATLGFPQRLSEGSASDASIGWKGDLGLIPEIQTKLGIPETLKPSEQRGVRFGANYHF